MKPEALILWGAAALAVYVMWRNRAPRPLATVYPIGAQGGYSAGSTGATAHGGDIALITGAAVALGSKYIDDKYSF